MQFVRSRTLSKTDGQGKEGQGYNGFTFALCTPVNGPLLSEVGCQVGTLDMNDLTPAER